MFCNARWYDPRIMQFNQPDSIVPNPLDPADFNRYAYARYNPLRYSDPSGYTPKCADGIKCYERQGPRNINNVLLGFGITTSGLTLAEREEVADTARLAGEKLAEIVGGSAEAAFRAAHGNISYTVTDDPIIDPRTGEDVTEGCLTVGSSITCNNAQNTQGLLHEFGHVFDNHYKEVSEEEGDPLASNHLPWGDSTDTGYECPGYPCRQHPGDYSTAEQFADMYMNWILDGNPNYPNNGFTGAIPPGYGIYTRGEWMDERMPIFLANMGLLP